MLQSRKFGLAASCCRLSRNPRTSSPSAVATGSAEAEPGAAGRTGSSHPVLSRLGCDAFRPPVRQEHLEHQSDQHGRQEPLPEARALAEALIVSASCSGFSQRISGRVPNRALKLGAGEGGRVGLGRVDVDGEGHLLGRLLVGQAHEVDAGLVRLGIAEALAGLIAPGHAHDLSRGPDDLDLGIARLIPAGSPCRARA